MIVLMQAIVCKLNLRNNAFLLQEIIVNTNHQSLSYNLHFIKINLPFKHMKVHDKIRNVTHFKNIDIVVFQSSLDEMSVN